MTGTDYAGGVILLQSNFNLEAVVFGDNSAYFGGAIFISADLATNAILDSITFTSNTAALGASHDPAVEKPYSV